MDRSNRIGFGSKHQGPSAQLVYTTHTQAYSPLIWKEPVFTEPSLDITFIHKVQKQVKIAVI